MEDAAVEDMLEDIDGKSVTEIAREILARSGWANVP